MRLIVGLILAGQAVVAWAQLWWLPSLISQGAQIVQGPSLADIQEMRRQGVELQKLNAEINRLERVGRFDEAEVLDRRRFELMSSGPLGRAIKEAQQRAGTPTLSMRQVGKVHSDQLRLKYYLMDADGASFERALFVRPLMTDAYDPGSNPASLSGEELHQRVEGLAHLYEKDYAAAGQSFEKAYLLSRDPNYVRVIASTEVARGQSESALRRLQSAIDALEKKNPHSIALASMLWQQASIHNAAGAYALAAEVCERALGVVLEGDQSSALYAAAQNNLGVALQLEGNSALALEHYRLSFEAPKRGLRDSPPERAGPYRRQVPAVASNIGLALWQLGDLPGAANLFRTALEERALLELGWSAHRTERAQIAAEQALAVEVDALVTLEKAANSIGLGLETLLERKGALLDERTQALAAFRRKALAQSEEQKKEQGRLGPPGVFGRLFASPPSREEVIREQQRVSGLLIDYRDLLHEYDAALQERATTPRTEANAAYIAELDMRIQVMQVTMQEDYEQARDEEISPNANAPQQGAYGDNPQQSVERYIEESQALARKQKQAREQFARSERASLVPRVQARLPPSAVLLEVVRYRPFNPGPGLAEDQRWSAARYGTYVVHPDSEIQYVDFGEADVLDKQIAEFRAALANPVSVTARDLGRRLDEVLMRPVRAFLGSARTLYVAPEGSLNLIPFGALVDENGAYLVERYTINYLPSGRDLLHMRHNDPARSPALIIADPAFDQQAATGSQAVAGISRRSVDFRSMKFDRLPGTEAEAQSLRRILPDAIVLTGDAATETAVKKVAGPRILHIATHGFFLEDAPREGEDPMLRSGLVFAGVNAPSSGRDDGVLTALEAGDLDLRGTKLVVLSACDTGLGEVKNGEGVFGLRRAFVVSGAETLLITLWQVADEPTKELMTSYYVRVSRGEPRVEALRQAQLAMLADPKTAHPFFWASFISSGEPGPLK